MRSAAPGRSRCPAVLSASRREGRWRRCAGPPLAAHPRSASVLRLELDHLGLVDLVHGRAVRPRQPVGPGIQSGGQDHRLTDTRGGGVGEQPVEMACADRHSLGRPLQVEPGVDVLQVDLTVERAGRRSRGRPRAPAARRTGRRSALRGWRATRCAATMVAVAPTLDARSQLSLSVRAIENSYCRVAVTASESRIGASSSLSGKSRPYARRTSPVLVRAVTCQPCSVRYSTTGLRSPG